MKNLFSRFVSILTLSALLSFVLSSCSDINNGESASVSFSISPELAKAVLGAGRSARAGDDITGESSDTSIDPTAQKDVTEIGSYRIEVSISGAINETQTKTFSASEWSAIAAGKGGNSTFTFNEIPVGSEILASVTIYLDTGGHLVWPCMTGSTTKIINAGENLVPVNVHKLAKVNIYNNIDTVEEISNISQLDVYALSEDSTTASRIFELLGSGTSSSEVDSEIYEKLAVESRIHSYSKPSSQYLTGGYELKDGQKAYMFTLLYTDGGDVYVGYPAATSDLTPDTIYTLTTINIDEINYIYLYLKKLDLDYTYIFPSKYADKTVSAWYVGENIDENADYNGTVPVTKTEYSAVFLFSDKTFVITSHSKKVDSSGTIWKEKIHYVMRGNYELEDSGTFENGTLILTPSAMYEANDNSSTQGWIELTEAQSAAAKMTCSVSSGSFMPPSDQMENPYSFYKKAEDAYLRVYRGEIDDSLAQSSGGEPEQSVDYSALCFFPTSYENKTVVAWYASEDVQTEKTKFFALYLFEDGEFVATKRTITNSGEAREIEMSGEYSLQTPNNYQNNTGSAQAKVGDETKVFTITISGGVFSVEGVDTTWAKQSGDVPTAQSESSGSTATTETGSNFYIDDSKIEITAEPQGTLYLNSGTINLNAYLSSLGPEEGRIDTTYWSVKLYYAGSEVDSDFYEFWDDGYVQIGGNKQLVVGGMYQLYVTAKNVLTNSTVIASATFNLEVVGKNYFEYDISTVTADELETDLAMGMKNLNSDALVVVKGDPAKTDGLDYASGYFTAISTALKNNTLFKVDLDMSETGDNLSTMSETDALSGCSCLNSVILSRNLLNIGANSFKDLSGLVSFSIQDYGYNRTISDGAFYNCSALAKFDLLFAEDASSNYSTTANGQVLLTTGESEQISGLSYQRQKIIAVAATLENFDLSDEELFPGAQSSLNGTYINEIGDYAFCNHKNLKSIANIDTVKKIGAHAFEGCTGIENFALTYLPNNLGASAFASCNFDSVEVNSLPSTIGDYPFDGATVTNLTVNVDVTSDNYATFEKLISVLPTGEESRRGMSGLNTVTFNKKAYFPEVTTGEDYRKTGSLFYNSNYLNTLVFNDSTTIGAYHFSYFGYIKTITFNDSSASSVIETSAFEGVSSITSLDLTGVKMVGRNAFKINSYDILYSGGTFSFTIPDSLVAICYGAFYKLPTGSYISFSTKNTSGWYKISGTDAEATVKGWVNGTSTKPTSSTIGEEVGSEIASDTMKTFISPTSSPSSSDSDYNCWIYRIVE